MGKVFTHTLTDETLTITREMGFTNVSLRLVSGTVTVTGTERALSLNSTAITMVDGVPITFTDNDAIDGLTINASPTGSVEILAVRTGSGAF